MIYLLIFVAEFLFLFILSRILVRFLSRFLALKLFHLILLPGVIVHELSHLITAKVLFVRVVGLNFSPKLDGDKLVMGSVGIRQTDPIRRSIIGFAPVLIGTLLIAISIFYFQTHQSALSFPWNYFLVFLVVFEIGNTMFSSRSDLEGSITLVLITAITIIVCYFLGFRIPESIFSFFNSDYFVDLVKKGIWVLLFPIMVDAAIIFLSIASTKRN